MVNIANPMMDAEMDDQTRAYIGVLERQNIGLNMLVNKQKAVIGALSGQPVEELLVNMEEKEVLDIVSQVIQNRDPNLSRTDAVKIARAQLAGQGDQPAP